jgi:AraC-like DNA-binding protein/mannose-6-phosphate isomerase-like protein (cupin superfamily)
MENNIKKIAISDSGIIIQSRIKRPDFGDKPHSHNHLSIIYVVSGQGQLQLGNQSFDLQPNTIISLKPGLLHKFQDKPKKQMTVFSIYFDPEKSVSNKYIVDYLFNKNKPFELPIYYAQQTKKNLRQMLHEQSKRPPGYKMAINQLFNLTLLDVYRAKLEMSKNDNFQNKNDSITRVQTALEHISQNSHQQFSLSEAAKLAKVSQRQFTNICRKITGKSFVKFLNQQRCEKAREFVINTDMPVASIAFETGYEELSTFYRAFKSIYKTSPLALREDRSE